MKLPARTLPCLVALALASAPACSSSNGGTSGKTDGGGDADRDAAASAGGATAGGGGAGGASAGSGGQAPLVCGSAECTVPPRNDGLESSPCCSPAGACGIRIPLSATCFEKNQPGTLEPLCAPYVAPGSLTMPGCCSPTGCGAYTTIAQIGCIANPDLGRAAVPCLYQGTCTEPGGCAASDGGGSQDAASTD